MKKGRVDAFATDGVALSQFAEADPNLKVVGEPFSREPYGIGTPSNDSRFRDLVNFTLQEMKSDGKYDEIYSRWFGERVSYIEMWPGMPNDPVLKRMIITKVPVKKSKKEPYDKYKYVTVKKNDNLWNLAEKHLGDGLLAREICNANQDIIGNDCTKIKPGQILKIPKLQGVRR